MTDGPSLDRPDLATDRLLLRRPDAGDLDAIAEIAGDREVARRLARVPHPYGPADARFFLDHVAPVEWIWAVTLRGSARLIGVVGLTPDRAGTAELGYWLAPACWGRGIMSEAARAVVSFGTESLGLSLLTAAYFVDNPASGRVLRKLGFVEVGRGTRPCLAVGGEMASVAMELPCAA